MHRWLNTEFVARWWSERPNFQQVIAKYSPRIRGEQPTRGIIIQIAGKPVGYIQVYRIRDWPDYAKYVASDEDAAGVDLFTGETENARRGLGPAIIRAFLDQVVFATMGVENLMRSCAEFLTANFTATGLDKGG